MIDLHTHLGGAVPTSVLWELLCDNGLSTEFENFDALQKFLTVNEGDITNLDDFLDKYFHATELIQSSPQAAFVSVYQAVAKAYRRAQISGMEIRFNPLKRLRSGLHSLDSIILSAIQGLQKASMHYGVKTGIIFSMAKEFSIKTNIKIIEAAMKFRGHGPINKAYGVVGLDMAGPESEGRDHDKQWLGKISAALEEAKKLKLGITWHVGETGDSGVEGMRNIIEIIRPNRIGHGVELRNADHKNFDSLCDMIKENKICLEICPTVNILTKSVDHIDELVNLIKKLDKKDVKFSINTDNPYLIHTNIRKEHDIIASRLDKNFNLREKSLKSAEESTFMK